MAQPPEGGVSQPSRPRVLTIAGSDSGGGAGIQADLKTFAAHGVYGMSAITAITAQNTVAVTAIHPVPPEVIAAQLDAVLDDIGADAVKIGMLGDVATIEVVASRLDRLPGVPIVLDPVMVAKSGARLLAEDAVTALRERLVPLATLVTPNLPEAAMLTGLEVDTEAERRKAGFALCRDGAGAALIKGGHGTGAELVDLLCEGGRATRFVHARQSNTATHGTGCTLSSAIAARLARRATLEQAVTGALEYLQGAIKAAFPLGRGVGPVDHLWRGRLG